MKSRTAANLHQKQTPVTNLSLEDRHSQAYGGQDNLCGECFKKLISPFFSLLDSQILILLVLLYSRQSATGSGWDGFLLGCRDIGGRLWQWFFHIIYIAFCWWPSHLSHILLSSQNNVFLYSFSQLYLFNKIFILAAISARKFSQTFLDNYFSHPCGMETLPQIRIRASAKQWYYSSHINFYQLSSYHVWD